MGFGVRGLGFRILEFGISSFWFCVWDLEFDVWFWDFKFRVCVLEFLCCRIGLGFLNLGFELWSFLLKILSLKITGL